MIINTTRFGTQEIDPGNTIHFPEGLPGFEKDRKFQLFSEETDQPLIFHMQSIESPDVSFPVCDAQKFGLNYDISLNENEKKTLQLENPEDAIVLIMLSDSKLLGHPQRRAYEPKVIPHITVPLIINHKTKIGMQKSLSGVKYDITVKATPKEE